MRYDIPGLRDEDFEPIGPDDDKLEDVCRAHPEWSDKQIAEEAMRIVALRDCVFDEEDVVRARARIRDCGQR